MNCSFFQCKGPHSFEGTYSRRDFFTNLINVFTPKEMIINRKTQRFGMINSLDNLVSILISKSSHWTDNLCLDPIIISSVLATFKLSLLAFSQQLRLFNSGVKAFVLLMIFNCVTCYNSKQNFYQFLTRHQFYSLKQYSLLSSVTCKTLAVFAIC